LTRDFNVISIESRKQWCDEHSKNFKERSSANYAFWKTHNEAPIAEVSQLEIYDEAIQASKNDLTKRFINNKLRKPDVVKVADKYQHLSLLEFCSDDLIQAMGGPDHPEASFSSPKKHSTYISDLP